MPGATWGPGEFPIDEAVRSCGGQFVACGHLPVQSIASAIGNFGRFDDLGDIGADGDFP